MDLREKPRTARAMRAALALAFVCMVGAGCGSTPTTTDSPALPPTPASTFVWVSASDVQWEHLNPARGDKSPQAGTLWGDRKGTAPTGFLAKFVDGFSSPPHLHNATYRAVVISGSIHNDDPQARESWMPVGSFWTQPKGEVHITAAKGPSVALVEIDQGPYLVLPSEEAFDSGERAINVHTSNLVWVDPPGIPSSAGPKLAYLWGNLQPGQPNGTFVRLPPGFGAKIHSHGATFRAVVIQGTPSYHASADKTLAPGSYFGSTGEAVHEISSSPTDESIVYVRTEGRYEVTARRP